MRQLVRLADGLAGLFLCLLLAVVTAQILTRALYRLSAGRIDLLFTGAIELASYALLLVVFSVLPGAVYHGLVRVDLFTARWPVFMRSILDRAGLGLTGLVALAIASQMMRQALRAASAGWTTQELDLPLAPFYGYAGVLSLLFAVVAFASLREDPLNRETHAGQGAE